MIRFFHVHIEKKIREYFNVDRLVRARDAIQEETRAAELTAGFKAAMNVCGNEDRKQSESTIVCPTNVIVYSLNYLNNT